MEDSYEAVKAFKISAARVRLPSGNFVKFSAINLTLTICTSTVS